MLEETASSRLDEIISVTPDQTEVWDACIRIYTAAFPRKERESEGALRRRLDTGRYRMRAGLRDGEVAGFVILDIEPPYNFALLSYLVVDEAQRGKGYGTDLTNEAIRLFREETDCDWLLIEARDRQAELYGRLGFLKVDLDFRIPHYVDADETPMHLMAYPRGAAERSIPAGELKEMIDWLYRSGYLVADDDPRLARQLAAITGDAALMDWPPSTV